MAVTVSLSGSFAGSLAGAEGGEDRAAVDLGAQQFVQQDAGLERIEEPRADQPAGEQVAFGAGEGVGRLEDGARSGARGEYDRLVRGEPFQRGHQAFRDVTR